MAGQFGGWTPIGAEQTATGYEVAWKVTGTNQFTVWTTDSNGNYISNSSASCREPAPRWKSLETSFHQDLNGDGVIGVRHDASSSSFGSTSLVEVGTNYFLDNSAGSGPELKYAGAAVVAGQFGGWTPIGAEQTATGYEVAWKVTGTDQYSVWTTDSNGNYISNHRHCVGNQLCAGIARDQFPSGSQWRRDDRCSDTTRDRVVWLDQPGRGRQQLFP